MDTMRQRLLAVLREECLIRGHFKLHGGGETDTYIDCRKLWKSSVVRLVAGTLIDLVEEMPIKLNTVGTIGVGGRSLLNTFLLGWRQFGSLDNRFNNIDGFCVRDRVKDHGVTTVEEAKGENTIDGCLDQGAKVLLLDDVLTTGKSLSKVEKVVKGRNGTVVGALVLVDRRNRVTREQLENSLPWPTRSVFTLEEIIGQCTVF